MVFKKSKHFVVHYQPKSTAEAELAQILDLLEKRYNKIIKELNIKIRPTIKCYLYQTKKAKLLATGEAANAHTNREKYEFFAIYNTSIKAIGCHEIVHLLTNDIGLPNYIFNEGLAEYFEADWTTKIDDKLITLPLDKWVQRFIKDKEYISVTELFNDCEFWELDPNGTISYPEAGSFIGYLVDIYGVKRVMLAYSKLIRKASLRDNLLTFQEVFGKKIEQIEKDWLARINN